MVSVLQRQAPVPALHQRACRIPWDAHPAALQGLICCQCTPAVQPRKKRGLLDLLPHRAVPSFPASHRLQGARPVGEVHVAQGHHTRGPAPSQVTSAQLPALTELQEPALPVRVEEGVGEVIAIILRDFEGFILDALVEILVQNTRHQLCYAQEPRDKPALQPSLSPSTSCPSPGAAPQVGPPHR